MTSAPSKMLTWLAASLSLAIFVTTGSYAHSKEPEIAFVILGAAKIPEYLGSDHYDTVPFVVSQFQYGNLDIEIEGLTTYALLNNGGHWRPGLSLELDAGRNDETKNPLVASLESINPAANFGGLIDYTRSSVFMNDDELDLKLAAYTDINDVHNGLYSTLTLTYALPVMIPWRFELEAETTYADSNYMTTYFGIDQSDSQLTGLNAFAPGNSFRDFTLTANAILFFNSRSGIFTRLSWSQLLDEARDSPIVELGNDQQYFIGVGAFYRFGG